MLYWGSEMPYSSLIVSAPMEGHMEQLEAQPSEVFAVATCGAGQYRAIEPSRPDLHPLALLSIDGSASPCYPSATQLERAITSMGPVLMALEPDGVEGSGIGIPSYGVR
jgi:hypothetical protein